MKTIILAILILSNCLLAQMTRLEGTNLLTESDIFVSEDNKHFSKMVTFKFSSKIIELPINQADASLSDIKNSALLDFFKSVKNTYGDFNFKKVVPSAIWGENIITNKRTGKTKIGNDFSQVFQISFEKLVPVDEVCEILRNNEFIQYADPPVIAYSCTTTPDDYYYDDTDHSWSWYLDSMDLKKAWDFTTGSSSIEISINDSYGTIGTIHNEIDDKVTYNSGSYSSGHGINTAGYAACETDNGAGMASVGWNIDLQLHGWTSASQINDAVNRGADIINFSWYSTYNNSTIRTAVENALDAGVICVASAGNADHTPPYTPYPAAWSFGGSTGQVIAVSGTWNNDTSGTYDYEVFRDGWNYSPTSNNFIDVAAPGESLVAFADDGTSNFVEYGSGTSYSAPMVAGIIGLMLSMDNTLTVNEVYDIITGSAEKIGQYSYDSNGWNKYMGYGRVNAFNALSAVEPPATPANFDGTWYNNHPKITWDANSEPDLKYYLILKNSGSGYDSLTTTTNTYYVDYSENKYSFPYTKTYVYYKAQAVDITAQKSAMTNYEKFPVNAPEQSENEFADLSEIERSIPDKYELSQNHPNPFNPVTEIRFGLPEAGFTTMKIYNINGQLVKTLIEQNMDAGYHNTSFGGNDISSGIYFYELTSANFRQLKRMLLLK